MTGLITAISFLLITMGILFLTILNSVIRSKIILDEAILKLLALLSRRLEFINTSTKKMQWSLSHESHGNNILQLTTNCESVYKIFESDSYSNSTLKLLFDTENSLRIYLQNCLSFSQYSTDQESINHIDLQKRFLAMENDLEDGINYLNKTINEYNLIITTYPGKIVALIRRFKPFETFDLKVSDKKQNTCIEFISTP